MELDSGLRREGGQGTVLEPGPEMEILEFRRKRLSTKFQLETFRLEMSNVWLGEELHSRDEKEVVIKNQTKDVAEQVDAFSTSCGVDWFQGGCFSSKNI